MRVRYIWVDWAKALAIIMVVMGHASFPYISFLIYAVHIPLFFVISGFLYRPKVWYNTLLSFVIPVSFFSLISALYLFFVNRQPISEWWEGICFLKYSFSQPTTLFTGLWFLQVLFFIRFFYGDASSTMICHSRSNIFLGIICFVASSIIGFMKIESPYWLFNLYLSRTVFCIPFFAFGIWLQENKISMLNMLKIRSQYFWMLVLAFIFIAYFNRGCDIFSASFGINYAVFFFNAIIGVILLFIFLQRMKYSAIIQYCSIGTLAILGLHSLIIDVITKTLLVSPIMIAVLSTLTSVLVGCLVTVISLRYCPILIGKTGLK